MKFLMTLHKLPHAYTVLWFHRFRHKTRLYRNFKQLRQNEFKISQKLFGFTAFDNVANLVHIPVDCPTCCYFLIIYIFSTILCNTRELPAQSVGTCCNQPDISVFGCTGFFSLCPYRSRPQRGYHLYPHINRMDSIRRSCQ